MNETRKTGNNWLRWFFSLALSVGVLSGAAYAQSLAEVAEKEKKRRTEVEGSSKVISERDLRTRRSSLLPSSAPAEGGVAEDAGREDDKNEPEADETKTREYWQNRVAASRKKMADLESKLQSPENDWGGGMRTDVNPVGQRNLSGRDEIESQLAAARSELAQIQDEARRAGVPAGWVR